MGFFIIIFVEGLIIQTAYFYIWYYAKIEFEITIIVTPCFSRSNPYY